MSRLELDNYLRFLFHDKIIFHRENGIYKYWKINSIPNDSKYEMLLANDNKEMYFCIILDWHPYYKFEELVEDLYTIFSNSNMLIVNSLKELSEMDRLLYL